MDAPKNDFPPPSDPAPSGARPKTRSVTRAIAGAVRAGASRVKKSVRKPKPKPDTSKQPTESPPPSTVKNIPKYNMKLSPNKWDDNDAGRNKSDAAIYPDGVKLVADKPNWEHQRLFVEFKLGGTANDPFDDAEYAANIETTAKTRAEVRGQLLAYADRVFAYQHRTGLFSMIVIGHKFRFMRWDRSGVFVTEMRDYVEDPTVLVELLLGFIILDDESQGIDPTATMLSPQSADWEFMDDLVSKDKPFKLPEVTIKPGALLPDELSHAVLEDHPDVVPMIVDPPPDGSSAAPPAPGAPSPQDGKDTRSRVDESQFVWEHERICFRHSLKDWPRYRLKVGEDNTFLVGRPQYEMSGLIGRGTRGYTAYHKESGRFVFLKDAWRPHYDGIELEGDILKTLNSAGVRNVTTVIVHGFVEDQTTRVSEYSVATKMTNKARKEKVADAQRAREGKKTSKRRREDASGKIDTTRVRHYAHYRLVVKEICISLNLFLSSRQLMSIIRDALQGKLPRLFSCHVVRENSQPRSPSARRRG